MRIGFVLAGGTPTDSDTRGAGAGEQQLVPPVLAAALPGERVVVAADSGLDLAERLGIRPDVVVGDLDSVSAGALSRADAAGVEVVRFDPRKDRTDLDLAVEEALVRGAEQIVVIGGGGGRLDHLIGNLGVLARCPVPAEAWMGDQFAVALAAEGQEGQAVFSAELAEGTTVSVLPWGGPVVVSESGVEWPLDRHRIEPGETLGISNVAVGGPAAVRAHEGRCLVVLPDAHPLTRPTAHPPTRPTAQPLTREVPS